MANVSVSNTPGLYIGSGASTVLNNAQQLLSLLSNQGNVNFALAPGNTTVQGYFIGNIPATYGNSNVAAYLLTNTGNIAAGYFLGDGSQLTNLPQQAGTYTNANVAAFLPTFDGNIGQPAQRPYFVYSSYFVGDGSGLTNLPSTGNYGNANVAAFLPTNTSNVAATYFIGDGSLLTNLPIPGVYGNANVAAYLLTNTGNIAAGYFIGDGSQLTNIPGSNYGNANVAAYLPTYTGSLAQSSSIVTLTANAASQASDINTIYNSLNNIQSSIGSTNANVSVLSANVGAFETYANANFVTTATQYGNTQVAAYLPTYTGNIGKTISSYIGAVAVETATLNQVQFINGTPGQDIALQPDDGNDVQINADTMRVGDNNTDFTMVTHGTGNLTLTTHQGDANQGNITLVDGANGNIKLWPNGSGIVEAAGNVKANYFIGDGSQLTGLPVAYGNTQVAEYLPTYTGTLAQSSTIIDLYSNAATQATGINTLNANLGAFQTYANTTFGTSSYSNVQVAAYLPTYTGNIGNVGVITGSRYMYSGNTYIQSNAGGATGGTIVLQAGKTSGFSSGGNIYVLGNQIEMGYGLQSDSKITLNGYTHIKTGNATPGVSSGNVLTVSQGNVNLINTNNAGGGITDWGGYLWVSNTATANRLVTNTGIFWSNGTSLVSDTYGNTQVAAYLPTYTGQIAANITDSTQPGIQYIGPNPNNGISALRVDGGLMTANANVINLNSGIGSTTPGSINITAYNTTNPNPGSINISAGSLNLTGGATFDLYGDPVIRGGNLYLDTGWVSNEPGGIDTGIVNANVLNITNGIFWANGTAYSTGGGGGSNFTSNLTVNGNYILNANINLVREQFANIGTINGTTTINANTAMIQAAAVASNITINTTQLTNFLPGQTITLKLTQATNTNLRILTSNILFAGGSKTLSTANAAIDTLTITFDGEQYLGALVKGYS